MDLGYYRNFIAIVEAGSISKAAAKVHIAQPALSAQLKSMEREYGTKLIEVSRGVHTLKVTDAGKIFYHKALALSNLENDAHREIDACAKGIEGTLKISLAPSRTPLFVSKYLKVFAKQYPMVNYQLTEAYHQELVANVVDGKTEIGIANAPLPDPDRFDILYSRKENIVIVGHKKSNWIKNKKGPVSIKELQNVPLVVTRGHYGLLLQAFRQEKIVPYIFALVSTRSTALRFAEEKLALAVIPKEKSEDLAPNLWARPFTGTAFTMEKTIFKLRGKPLSAPMLKFLEVYETCL
jgi:DNA-binding transcriptional LysR family regulator